LNSDKQEDVLNATSTVRETILFAARLRLPESIPDRMKQERAFEVIKDLGLMDVADVRIGDGVKRGISGGERRRVSIGVELVASPDILVLDEPTSVSLVLSSLHLLAHVLV
jgi:ABC-type multidrug transport system ATPase subunit